ncbi:MAG: type II toxin-antitoxin system VapC family toxin [Deltaproteobacteria bacterium]|nr:type II toxin-antitoxin system VapC family toxin [Deltaproteobacteria bacterium]
MRLLLDTHAFLWWVAGDARMTRKARAAIGAADSDVYVSAASAWEITTKFRIGKLPGASAIVDDLVGVVASQSFLALPITLGHAQAAGLLAGDHRDPFDRMLIAQANAEQMMLVSSERIFESYGVRRLW